MQVSENHLPEPWPLLEPTSPWSGENFHSNAERPKLADACHRSIGTLHPRHAQVPRHPPDTHRPPCAHRRDALAPGPAAASAGGQRQNCPLHCLRRTRLPPGPHGPLWPAAGLHWRECLWWHHRAYPAFIWAQRRYAGLDCRYCRRGAWNCTRTCLPQAAQDPRLNPHI